MAAAPITSEPSSDRQLDVNNRKTPISPVTDVTIAQLFMSKTSPKAPLTPSSDLMAMHKRLKLDKKHFSPINLGKKRSKDKAEHDPSRTSSSLKKDNANKDSNDPVQISETMIRAQEIQSTIGNEHPTFIKTMLKSHISDGFWMGLPLPFCRSFLPKDDSLMITEDENGEQCDVKFIAKRFALGGGWRQFAISHKLLEGDVLIFQLVESCKFKIYIVRANNSEEVDGDVNVKNQNAQVEHKTPASIKTYLKSIGRKCSSLGSGSRLTEVKKKYKRSKPPVEPNNHPTNHSMVNSHVQEGSFEPNHSLNGVKTFKDFHIKVNDQCIDPEISEEIRINYYNLCIGKNEILHDSVREGLYHKLVAGMIGETISIANMIRNCKLTTRKEEFDAWDSSLKYFELMGMKVGFLRDRVGTLANFTYESEDAITYAKAKEERSQNANEMKKLEAKLVELSESKRKIDGIVNDLKEKAERCEIEFKSKVDAPW